MRNSRSPGGACLCLLLGLMCAIAGCADAVVGERLKQTREGVETTNASPHAIAQTDAEGQWTATSPTPATSTQLEPTGNVSTMTTGVSRELLASVQGSPWVLRSGSDINIQASEATFAADGSVQVKGFTLGTSTSTPTIAANAALAEIAAKWTEVPAASRDVLIKELEVIRDTVPELADVAGGLIKLFAGVP